MTYKQGAITGLKWGLGLNVLAAVGNMTDGRAPGIYPALILLCVVIGAVVGAYRQRQSSS